MTPSARLSAVVELLIINFEVNGRAEQAVSTYFKNRRFAGSKDRRWITEQFYLILRRLGELDWIAEQVDLVPTARIRACLSLIVFNDISAAEVAQKHFEGAHALTPPEPSELDAFVKASELDLAKMPETATANFPLWIIEKLGDQYGDRLPDILQSFRNRAPASFRVNLLKTSVDTVMQKLQEEGIGAGAMHCSPNGFSLDTHQNLTGNALYREGAIEVQDEAAQISALLAGAKPGMQVVDYCAGGGGKTLALGANMGNSGQIYALDIEARRMKDIAERCKRADLHNVQQQVIPEDGQTNDALEKIEGGADIVFVDAPCSGSGTWRRQPEQKWFLTEEKLAEYVKLQAEIIEKAAKFVKPGGRLVYATCSLFAEENANQVDAFLAKNTEYKAIPVDSIWTEAGLQGEPISTPYMQITPNSFGADGFFTAVLQRQD